MSTDAAGGVWKTLPHHAGGPSSRNWFTNRLTRLTQRFTTRLTRFCRSPSVTFFVWLAIGFASGTLSSYVVMFLGGEPGLGGTSCVRGLRADDGGGMDGEEDLKQRILLLHQQEQQIQQQQEQIQQLQRRAPSFVIVAVHIGDAAPVSFRLSRNGWWREGRQKPRRRMGGAAGAGEAGAGGGEKVSNRGDGDGGGGPIPVPPPPDPPPPHHQLSDHSVVHFVDSAVYYRAEKRPGAVPLRWWSSPPENVAAAAAMVGSKKSNATTGDVVSEVVGLDGLAGSSLNKGFERALRVLVADDDDPSPSSSSKRRGGQEHSYIFVAGDILLDEDKLCKLIHYVQFRALLLPMAMAEAEAEKKKWVGGGGGVNGGGEPPVVAGDDDRGGRGECSHRLHLHRSDIGDGGGGEGCDFMEGLVVTRETLEKYRRRHQRDSNCSRSSGGRGGPHGCNTGETAAAGGDDAATSQSYLDSAPYVQCYFYSQVNNRRGAGHTCRWRESLKGHQMEHLRMADVISPSPPNNNVTTTGDSGAAKDDPHAGAPPRPAFRELYMYFKEQRLRELTSRADYLYSEVSAAGKMVSLLSHGRSLGRSYREQFDSWTLAVAPGSTNGSTSDMFMDGGEDTHWEYTNDRFVYTTHNIHKSPAQKLIVKGSSRILEDSLGGVFRELSFVSPYVEEGGTKFHHTYRHISPVSGVWHFVNVFAIAPTATATNSSSGSSGNRSISGGSKSGATGTAEDKKLKGLMFLTAEKFRPLQVTEEPSHRSSLSSSTSEHICIIVPVAGRSNAFRRFLAMLRPVLKAAAAVANGDPNLSFVFIIFTEETAEGGQGQHNNDKAVQLRHVQLQHPRVSFRSVHRSTAFSRAEALQIGVGVVERGDDVILLFMDVDMVFTGEFLGRVRSATVRHRRAYFPIYFSQYKSAGDPCLPPSTGTAPADLLLPPPPPCSPGTSAAPPFRFRPDDGFWRFYGYGMVAIYKSDFLRVGGYDLKIRGWGLEDVKLYEECLNSDMDVLRAPDTGLVHVYHGKTCSPTLSPRQYGMCVETKNDIYLHQHTAAATVYGQPDLLNRAQSWKR